MTIYVDALFPVPEVTGEPVVRYAINAGFKEKGLEMCTLILVKKTHAFVTKYLQIMCLFLLKNPFK
jgi:hypothetical protein